MLFSSDRLRIHWACVSSQCKVFLCNFFQGFMGSSARGVWKAQKAPNATVNIMIISIQNRKNSAIVPEGRKWLQTKVAFTGSRFRKKKTSFKTFHEESLSLSHTLFSSCSQTLTSTLSPQRGFLWNDREISISLYLPTLVAFKATVYKMSHTHDCFTNL